MNKKLYIRLKGGKSGLWRLNEELKYAFFRTGYDPLNEKIAAFGLYYDVDNHIESVYDIIDEELFTLFLLEYSDKLEITPV